MALWAQSGQSSPWTELRSLLWAVGWCIRQPRCFYHMFVREVQKLAEIRTSRIAFVCIVGKCMHEVHKEIRICTSRKYVQCVQIYADACIMHTST